MAGCIPCFVIPLLLFIFHRYIQPILLKFWNPWAKLEENEKKEKCEFSCDCKWSKKPSSDDPNTRETVQTNECANDVKIEEKSKKDI